MQVPLAVLIGEMLMKLLRYVARYANISITGFQIFGLLRAYFTSNVPVEKHCAPGLMDRFQLNVEKVS